MNSEVPNRYGLSLVALFLVLLNGCGVEAINFTFNSFNNSSDVYIVANGGHWIYSADDNSLLLEAASFYDNFAGRFLYPHPVQMMDAEMKTAVSFSCNIIFQILYQGGNSSSHSGSGMAFVVAPDNFTVGGTQDYMGLLTANATESNLHTFGVEFDTHKNPEFNDPNDNHIGIDLRTMNSTATFIPSFRLAQGSDEQRLYHQVWIDYFQPPDSRMDLYISQYGQGKPTVPFTASVNLSFLNEYMYVGFSAAPSEYVHKILSWSFSTDGPAPPIWISGDRPRTIPNPGASPGSTYRVTSMVRFVVGLCFVIVASICLIISLYCWRHCELFGRTVRFFLAHSAGEDYAGKNFAERIYRELKSTWRYRLNLITVFFDRRSLTWAEDFPENLRRELNRTHVGIVIVTEEFFQKQWPMTELLSFVRRHDRMRILPLFYRLHVHEVRSRLSARAWDERWREMRQLNVGECRDAVQFLCNQRGIEYNAIDPGHDSQYIDEILEVLAQITDEMRHQPH